MSIVPSQMALLQAKQKLKSAAKGKDLLKRKADALKVQFHQVTKALIEQKKDFGKIYSQCLVSLAKANFSTSGGDVSRIVDENVKPKADVKLTLKTKPLAGVTIPQFGIRNIEEEKYGDSQILSITGGGQSLNIAKKSFYGLLKKIVEIATLQTSYLAIDECLKITNRRVNALEYIVIPRIQYTINYINIELDERAKEEKFKIKKVLQNKKKHKENEERIWELMNQGVQMASDKESQVMFEEDIEQGEGDEIDESEKLF